MDGENLSGISFKRVNNLNQQSIYKYINIRSQ